ncbi:MAG: 4Fe-4S binding protein [Lachnospiraceae bacterium]
MAYVISADCQGCGNCAEACPADAITKGDDGKYVINADECLECGTCEGECEHGAISAE